MNLQVALSESRPMAPRLSIAGKSMLLSKVPRTKDVFSQPV